MELYIRRVFSYFTTTTNTCVTSALQYGERIKMRLHEATFVHLESFSMLETHYIEWKKKKLNFAFC